MAHYQARLARGEDVKNFAWPDGFPLNGIPEVKALAKPPQNAKEFDWGPFDKPDDEMGDGQMVRWAEKFLADPPKQPFFLAAGIYRPHLPWYAPREYFDMYPPRRASLRRRSRKTIWTTCRRRDAGSPNSGAETWNWSGGPGSTSESCRPIWPASRSATQWSGGFWTRWMPVRRRRTRSSSSGPTTAGTSARRSTCTR